MILCKYIFSFFLSLIVFFLFSPSYDHGFPSFTIPNSNAFLDFDGDCHADLFFTEKAEDGSTKFSIWVWNATSMKYERSRTYNTPKGAGQVSFSDFSKT